MNNNIINLINLTKDVVCLLLTTDQRKGIMAILKDRNTHTYNYKNGTTVSYSKK